MPETSPESFEQEQKRKLSKAERFGLIGIICALIAALINGPIARYTAERTLNNLLPKMGMEGTYKIQGSIGGGFVLKDVNLDGTKGVKTLKADSLILDYQLSEVLKGKVRGITGENIELVFAVDEFPRRPKKEKPDATQASEEELREYENYIKELDHRKKTGLTRILRRIQSILREPNINFTKIDASLTRHGKEFISFHAEGLKHQAGSEDFLLQQFQTKSFGNKQTPIQDLTLYWSPDHAELEDVLLLPDIYLESLNIFTKEDSRAFYSTTGKIFDSQVTVTWVARQAITLVIDGAPLDLEKTVAIWNPEIPLQGILNRGAVRLKNYKQALAKWDADIALDVDSFQWKTFRLPNARFTGLFKDGDFHHKSLLLDEKNSLRLNAVSDFSRVIKWTDRGWWNNMQHDIQLQTNAIHFVYEALAPKAEKAKELTPDGSAAFVGQILTSSETGISSGLVGFDLREMSRHTKALPNTTGFVHYHDQKLRIQAKPTSLKKAETFSIDGNIDFKESSYQTTANIDLTKPTLLQNYMDAYGLSFPITEGPRINLINNGSFKEKRHSGSFKNVAFGFQKEGAEPVAAELNGSYSLPGNVTLDSASFETGDAKLTSIASWEDSTLRIQKLQFFDSKGKALDAEGRLPFPATATSEEDILNINEEIDFTLWTDSLPIKRIIDLLPIREPEGLTADISSEINLSGTYAEPKINGFLSLQKLTLPAPVDIPPLDIKTTFETENKIFRLNGSGLKDGENIININGTIPFHPYLWMKREKDIRNEPIEVTLNSNDFSLSQLEPFFPILKQVDGTVDTRLSLSETLASPSVDGEMEIKINKLGIENKYFSGLRDSTIKLQFDGDTITIPKSVANSSGGRFEIIGDINLENTENPVFDISLLADKALVYRDDAITLRADGNLNFKGPKESLTISGDVGFVEGVFYKDIEIIPFGVPRKSVPKPELPSTPSVLSRGRLPVPDFMKDWRLNLNLRMADPLLIRGNVARGSVVGNVVATGTLEQPKTKGTLYIKDLVAQLPFSKLEVNRGRIYTSNSESLLPNLDIRGQSRIGRYDVTLLIYGSSDNPQIAVSSAPPLPENEIYTLLATGTTTADLADGEIASAKAFQLLLNEIRARARRQGSSQTVRNMAKALGNFELSVGDRENYSGRVFSSATVKLHDRWFLSASVDREGDSRGLVVFSLRFH